MSPRFRLVPGAPCRVRFLGVVEGGPGLGEVSTVFSGDLVESWDCRPRRVVGVKKTVLGGVPPSALTCPCPLGSSRVGPGFPSVVGMSSPTSRD